MGESCTILAHVKNSEGKVVESRLFKDLLHYTSNNRGLAKEYYAVGTDERFLSKVRDSEEYQTDENGEITFNSLRTLSKMDIETDQLVSVLNKDIGQGEYPYDDAIRKIREFNENSGWADTMLATIVPSGNGKYLVTVIPREKTVTDTKGRKKVEGTNTPEEQQKLHDVVRNEELKRRIETLLRSHGVSVRFLEGDTQGGRYSTENAPAMENGLYSLIEVAKDGNVTDVMAEEAGHFAVGALGDNPLVKRLEGMLISKDAQIEALGQEEYDNALLGKNPAREVAGRLVGKALKRKLDEHSRIKVLANRIANLAKRAFYNFTGNEVRWAAAKAEQIANRIAYQFAEGKGDFSIENARNYKETMMNSSLTINQKVYRDTMDEFGRMVKRLEDIADDAFAGKMMASQGFSIIAGTDDTTGQSALQMKTFADSLAFDGIVQALVQLSDYIGSDKEIDKLLKTVNQSLDNPSEFYPNMARNGIYLRQARTFLRSAVIILEGLESATNGVGDDQLKLVNGATLSDVRYQDDKGNWRSVNMRSTITSCLHILAEYDSRLKNLESSYFVRYCEDIYGSKYVTRSTGILWSNIWNGTDPLGEYSQSIADLVKGEGMDDIDIFHRYLGSMSNNPDIIGQIADKLVKMANKSANDATLKFQERIALLAERADQLGFDMSDLAEKDAQGLPTGNLIMPPASYTKEGNREEDFIYDTYMSELGFVPAVSYGKWEDARKAYKRQLWEEFKQKNPGIESQSNFAKGFKWDAFLRPKMKKWNAENSYRVNIKDSQGNIIKVRWVPNMVFQSHQWEELEAKYKPKGNDSIGKWVYDYLKIKEELNAFLPEGATVPWRLPQFKGTFMDSVRKNVPLQSGRFKKTKAWLKTFGRRAILESFVETAEDRDYGCEQTMNSLDEDLLGTKLDYESERAQRIPIFGINKLSDMRDLSTDLCHSLLAYASMATTYKGLNDCVAALEVGREALYRRKIQNKTTSVEKALLKVGTKTRRAGGAYEVHETGSINRAYGRYIKFLDKQVYGMHASSWGISYKDRNRFVLSKCVKNLTSLAGFLFLNGNVLGGAVNTATGAINIFKEAAVGEDINIKSWRKAHVYYWKHFVDMWMFGFSSGGKNYGGQLGVLRPDHKLGLFLTQMDAQNKNAENFRTWYTKRNRVNNFFRMVGYLPYSSGDHYMQSMSYLAIAYDTMLYNTDGTQASNLWDAYERVENKDENTDTVAGYTLKFGKYKPVAATELTFNILDREGAYLRPVTKSTKDFEEWLIWQDAQFADKGYRSTHTLEYNNWRDVYDKTAVDDLMRYRADRYQVLLSILKKTEDYLKSNSPLKVAPMYTPKEEELLHTRNLRTDNMAHYPDILQSTKDGLYNLIWTTEAESAYMDKCREFNIRLHGIYNEQDKTAWHQNMYYNAFLAMKGWALGIIEQFHSSSHHSIALNRDVEGWMNTALKVPAYVLVNSFRSGGSALSWKDMMLTMCCPWSERSKKALLEAGFSVEQSYNAKRAVMAIFTAAFLYVLYSCTFKDGGGDDDDEDDEVIKGLIHYLAMRTMYEQEALWWAPEAFIQSGQLLNLLPAAGAAVYDLGLLVYQGIGALIGDEEDSDFFYKQDSKDGRYKDGDTKFWVHLQRLIPYVKSYWAIEHPHEASKNYAFGRKLKTR